MAKPLEIQQKKTQNCFVSWFVLPSCRSELSLGAASTSSLQGTVRVAPCDCEDQSCECLVASPSLNHTYLLWLEAGTGTTALGSPLLALQPADIGEHG